MLFVLSATYLAVSYSGAGRGEGFGFSSEDFLGGGSYLGVDTRDIRNDRPWQNFILRKKAGWKWHWWWGRGGTGVKAHVILTVDGNKVESVEQLRRMIREIPSGRTVAIGISRNGQPMTLKAVLADRKRAFAVGQIIFTLKYRRCQRFRQFPPCPNSMPQYPLLSCIPQCAAV